MAVRFNDVLSLVSLMFTSSSNTMCSGPLKFNCALFCCRKVAMALRLVVLAPISAANFVSDLLRLKSRNKLLIKLDTESIQGPNLCRIIGFNLGRVVISIF